jgi:hypothetical protein
VAIALLSIAALAITITGFTLPEVATGKSLIADRPGTFVPLPGDCDNAQDDDSDGLTDGEDPGCQDGNGLESSVDPEFSDCDNGGDDDGDGLTDSDDPGCQTGSFEDAAGLAGLSQTWPLPEPGAEGACSCAEGTATRQVSHRPAISQVRHRGSDAPARAVTHRAARQRPCASSAARSRRALATGRVGSDDRLTTSRMLKRRVILTTGTVKFFNSERASASSLGTATTSSVPSPTSGNGCRPGRPDVGSTWVPPGEKRRRVV